MTAIIRYGAAVFVAAAVTFGLFFIMQLLIATGKDVLTENSDIKFLDFIRVEEDVELEVKQRKVEKPPEPEPPPPDMPTPQFDNVNPDAQVVSMAPVNVGVKVEGGLGLSASDGEYLPIVKVAPIYPRRAAARGIEGYVIVEFTVTKNGSVRDPVVVEAEPSGIFDRAAMKAALKFKYKPRIEDGEPIEVHGVRNKITFQLEDDGGRRRR